MKPLIPLMLFLATFLVQHACAQADTFQYGQVMPNATDASGTSLLLMGGGRDDNFLKGLAAADNRGTFICNNIDSVQTNQSPSSLPPDTRIAFAFNGSGTVNDTIVACGTVTLRQMYRGDWVDTRFKFAAWTSAIAYPHVKSQMPNFTIAWIDYCPQNARNCESSAIHPEPAMPLREAELDGTVGVHDCQGAAEVSSITVQLVLNTTDEGSNFNHSMVARDVCETLPKTFNDDDLSDWEVFNDAAGRAKYSAKIKIKGRNVPAYLYICALADIHKGTDEDNCHDDTYESKIQRKISVTLQPDQTIHVDAIHIDYTR